MNRISTPLLLSLLLLSPLHAGNASAAPSQTAAQDAVLPISRVSLYTSGVGYFERRGTVDGDAGLTLLFPVDQVNDILKSLVLLDMGGGKIEPVTYAARDPLGKQLAAFSVDLSDNPDRATLLSRLRGAQVRVTSGSVTVSGAILSVETKTVHLPDKGGVTQESVLNLYADGELDAVPLEDGTTIQFTDPKLDSEIGSALLAVSESRDKNKRVITLHFDGRGKRTVVVGYVTETPLWQTSYRLVLGDKPILQGWAMVQNTSQDDWSGIHLDLISGRPISFVQDLYTPIYIPRPTIEAQVQAAPAPQAYAADMMSKRRFSAAATPMANVPMSAMASSPPIPSNGSVAGETGLDKDSALKNSIATSGATLGTSLFSYDIDVPVTIPRQQSAMIPFLSSSVEARRVSIYNVSVLANHPLTGARIVNTSKLHLMGGPITVFDDQHGGGTGYVGDAEIEDTEPGQTRLISFAVDLAVDADAKPGDDQGQGQVISISQGVLYDATTTLSSTVYTFKNNSDSPRVIVVGQPFSGDNYKLIEPAAATEKTADSYRFDVDVASRQSKVFTVKQQHIDSETYAVADCDLPTLVAYTKVGGISPAVRAALLEVIRRERDLAQTQGGIAGVGEQIRRIGVAQDRIRKNMNALDKSSALYKRYVSELDAQETQIQTLNAKMSDLQTQADRQSDDLKTVIANLTVK